MRQPRWPRRSEPSDEQPHRQIAPRRRLELTENQIVVATGLGLGVIYGAAVAFGGFGGGGSGKGLEPVQFSTASACAYAGFDEGLCEGGYAAALAEHRRYAPRFQTLATCETEWGRGGCTSLIDASLRVSATQPPGLVDEDESFVPLLTGFVLSPMMQRDYERTGGHGGGSVGLPIYRDRRGANVALEKGSGGVMVARPVNARTTTVVHSGFGGRGLAGGRRGFGG